MTYSPPSLDRILRRGASDWKYETGNDAARIPGRPERALVRAQAGNSWQMFQHLAAAIRNFFIRDADDEARLVTIAAEHGVDRKPAGRASGQITAYGTPGEIISAGYQWVRSDGAIFELLEDTEIIIGGTFLVRAVQGGADGNTEVGVEMYGREPHPDLVSPQTVFAEITGGIDIEPIEELRSRLLFRLRNPYGGGTLADYVSWAREVSGVTRAWAFDNYPKIGQVYVLFVRDGDGADDVIFPSAAQILEVQQYIDARKPGTITVVADAPVKKPIDVSVALDPNTAAVQAAVTQAIKDMLYVRAEPKSAVWDFPKTWVAEAISGAPGENDHVLAGGDIPHSAFDLLYYNSQSDPIVFT